MPCRTINHPPQRLGRPWLTILRIQLHQPVSCLTVCAFVGPGIIPVQLANLPGHVSLQSRCAAPAAATYRCVAHAATVQLFRATGILRAGVSTRVALCSSGTNPKRRSSALPTIDCLRCGSPLFLVSTYSNTPKQDITLVPPLHSIIDPTPASRVRFHSLTLFILLVTLWRIDCCP